MTAVVIQAKWQILALTYTCLASRFPQHRQAEESCQGLCKVVEFVLRHGCTAGKVEKLSVQEGGYPNEGSAAPERVQAEIPSH